MQGLASESNSPPSVLHAKLDADLCMRVDLPLDKKPGHRASRPPGRRVVADRLGPPGRRAVAGRGPMGPRAAGPLGRRGPLGRGPTFSKTLKIIVFSMETPCWSPSEGLQHGGRTPLGTSGV